MRTTPLLLLILGTLLSGCTGADTGTPDDTAPLVHDSVEDARESDPEVGKNRSHVHDYWKGRQEILVADEEASGSCTCGSSAPALRFEPPTGGIVPQGTRWVNITISWTTSLDSAYSEPHLWVKTAAEHAPRDRGAIESGDTLFLEIDEADADIPHESLSNWIIELHVRPPTGNGVYRMDVDATIHMTAARGYDLRVFPPHPDQWNGTNEILLFDESDAADPVYYGNARSNTGNDWLGPHVPENGTLVPYDMDHVVVEVTYGADAPVPFDLLLRDAASREWTRLVPDDIVGNTYTYTISSHDAQADGPYASQSHWIFEVDTTDQTPPAFVGGYDITATVFRTG